MLLSLSQVSERTGIPLATLRKWRWRFSSNLPLEPHAASLAKMMTTVGSAVRVPEKALLDWVNMKSFDGKDPEIKHIIASLKLNSAQLKRLGMDNVAKLIDVACDLV